MLRAIADNIEILTKPKEEIKLEKEEFSIFKELFFKWKKMYRYHRKYRNLYFNIPDLKKNDLERPLINSDERLLEQIIYNIVHNAVKYSHWGTIIKMDCKLLDNPGKRLILSVTDYGLSVDGGNKVYDLYYRGDNVKKPTQGSGIGLYIVKKISEILGFTLSPPKCTKISDYNIGAMNAYLNRFSGKNTKDAELLEKLNNERISIGDKFYQMVNKREPQKNLKEDEIIAMIHMDTYEVTFEVVI
jgi:hypothetical protein